MSASESLSPRLPERLIKHSSQTSTAVNKKFKIFQNMFKVFRRQTANYGIFSNQLITTAAGVGKRRAAKFTAATE